MTAPPRISADAMARVLARALGEGWLEPEDDAVIFQDLSHLRAMADHLKGLFPATTLHAVAIKTNPLHAVLASLNGMGLGAEAASPGELHLALRVGFPPHVILFDSPVKTRAELAFALERGVTVNANALEELERIADLLAEHPEWASRARIGLRVNPLVGAGRITATSVSDTRSKFGVPLTRGAEIGAALRAHSWLTGLHVHVGSQGYAPAGLAEGVGRVADLAVEWRGRLGDRPAWVDIGGGLAAPYEEQDPPPALAEYRALLEARAPGLFDGRFTLMTEFGRVLHAGAGWVASRVEYVHPNEPVPMLLTHVGADLFLRWCYAPADWHHQLSLTDGQGQLRTDAPIPQDVGGPLCFGGDVLARGVNLPPARAGDWLLIHDAGANTHALWSRHNSRAFPKVLGYEGADGPFQCLKPRETPEEVAAFWR